MTLNAPRLPFSSHPLIRRVQRARGRQAFIAAAAVLVAGAAVGWFMLRPAGAEGVFCAKPPSGWQARNVQHFGRTDLVLTNFEFGNLADNDGLLDAHVLWPRQGAMIAAIPWEQGSPLKRVTVVNRLRVHQSQFVFSGGAPHWITSRLVHFKGRYLLFWVEVRALTRRSVANANRALATLRPCSMK